jgi:histidinol dehydrogenase
MNVIRFTDKNFPEQLRALTTASSLFDKAIEERARTILDAVYTRGDDALLEFAERFDGAKLTSETLAVTTPEFLNASLQADDGLRQAVAVTGKNVELFSRKSLRRNWSAKNSQGARVGEKFDPFQVRHF